MPQPESHTHTDSSSPLQDDTGSGGQSLKRVWPLVLSAAFLALIVVLGFLALVFGFSDDESSSEAESPTPSAQEDEPPATGGFGIPYVDRLGRVIEKPANPEGVPQLQTRADWSPGDPVTFDDIQLQETKYGILPFSAKHGPWNVSECRAEGYSRTPQGAAIAALHLDARWSACTDVAAFRKFAESQIEASTAEIDSRTANLPRESVEAHANRVAASAAEAARVAAFRPDFAAIEFALPTERPSIWVTGGLTVVWRDSSWRYVPSRFTEGDHISDLAGWVMLR